MTAPDLDGYARYAICCAPRRTTPLGAMGAAWLGHDIESGAEATPAAPSDLAKQRAALVRGPRRTGIAALLKPPFELTGGLGGDALDMATAALARGRPQAVGPGLVCKAEAEGVALRPGGAAPEIAALAEACVTQLDMLRAPLDAQALAAARRAGLDMTEEANLRNWGHPEVLARFRFGFRLTGPLPRREAAATARSLGAHFAPILGDAFAIDEIALCGDPGEGAPLRLLRRYPLGAAYARFRAGLGGAGGPDTLWRTTP